MSWVIEVPAPCDWINSNHRTHRMEIAKRTAAWRRAAEVEASRRGGYFTRPVHIVATVHKTRGGRFDVCNLYPTIKACVDGVVDACVLVDDSNDFVIGPDMRAGEKRATACVVLRIEAIR